MTAGRTGQPQPTWQPITRLPLIAALIDETLAGVEEQHATLRAARPKPHVLDDALIARIRRSYGEQRDDLWLYEEQLRRWGATPLTAEQRREVARLTDELARLRTALDAILALADELSRGTIDRIMAMSDAELGLAMLTGQHRPPGPASPPSASDAAAVPSRVGQCPRCGAPATLAIFGGPVAEVADRMAGPVATLAVPAWVVGPPAGPGGSAEVLQVWPTRRPLGRMTAEAFAALVDRTGAEDCQPRPTAGRGPGGRRR